MSLHNPGELKPKVKNKTRCEVTSLCPRFSRDFSRFGDFWQLQSGQTRNTIFNAGIEYGILEGIVDTARKITVEVPVALLEKAQQASGAGVTQTVRTGLQLVAASRTYARLRKLRGKVRFSRTLTELKADR
ncbi:MAG: hypothetical protein DMG60_16685 [Acidobacteria bacterium]|nr:MAG: hypothetical protein DMG60_16685 [Acidobacteriota bacterium]